MPLEGTGPLCNICNATVAVGSGTVTCYGLCKQMFHSTCIKVSRSVTTELSQNPNLHWYCDTCVNSSSFNAFLNLGQRMSETTDSVRALIAMLENTLVDTLGKFNRMTNQVDKLSNLQAHDQRHMMGKRVRSPSPETSNVVLQNPVRIAHPLTYGIKKVSDGVLGVQQKKRNTGPSDPDCMKTVFVTRCAPNTTEADILKYLLSNSIIEEENEIFCKKLVPSGREISQLNFISFKLGVNDLKVYDALISASTWPENVAVRDFVENPAKPNRMNTGNFINPAKKHASMRSPKISAWGRPSSEEAADQEMDIQEELASNVKDILNASTRLTEESLAGEIFEEY